MKVSTIFQALMLTVAFVGMSFTVANVETYRVDTAQSQLTWKAYKVTGEHEGTINLKSGNLQFQDGKLTGGSFIIDMTSINNTDMEGKMKAKLEGHLKSADFFDVENHPTASFVITKAISRGTPGDYKIVGNLTIKNHTKEIKFLAKVNEEGGKLVAEADITVDRADFDVRYGSGSFFDDLGDRTIYDEFDVHVKLVATK
ncbi:MAG: lipid-binding protein [Saprospirales bacterium]|nr:lipid-binding protein [Saprospirales bacterium]